MARMKNILLNIANWSDGTKKLSKRLKGCYIDLMCLYYANGGPLPYNEEELCTELGYKNVRSLRVDLDGLFKARKIYVAQTENGPFIVNEPSDIEIAKFEARRQGNIRGGENGKPSPKKPKEPISSRYEADIEPISSRYRAENEPDIVECQQVSGNSSITLKFTTTTAHAHVRGPVLVETIPVQAPALAEDPADLPAPKALVSKIPTPARPVAGKPCAINPYIGPNAFDRVRSVPQEGTEEFEKYQRAQYRIAVTAKVKQILVEVGVWCEADELDSSYIAGWIASGADPELHIYPTVRTKAGKLATKGDHVWGLGIFTTDIGKAVKRERDVAANPNLFADTGKTSSGYSRSSGSSSPVPADVMITIKMARQNNWDELHEQMVNLLTPANAGDEQSLRLLNDLHAKHCDDVRERHSDWMSSHKSSAA